MTPQQAKRFDELGCVPRCLIKLCEMAQKPISKQDFCARFEKYFVNLDSNYGMLDPTGIFPVFQSLPIPQLKGIHGDYAVIKQSKAAGHHVLMQSQISLSPGKTDAVKHCSIITNMTDLEFSVWTPIQDGSDCQMTLPRSDWVDKQCIGIIF